MAVPQYTKMYRFVIEALSDGKEHHYNDCIAHVAKQMNLSVEDCQLMLSNGSKTVLKDRVQWALTHVRAAGLAEITKRGWSRITSEGLRILADSSIDLNNDYLMRYKSFVARFCKGKKTDNHPQHPHHNEEEKTPNERINDAFVELNKTLEEELLDEIIRKKDAKDYGFFESLVVDLVKAMGYGSQLENSGYVTPLSCDGGIDGIVAEDKLGFNKIYIQAKCWALDSTVGAPDIQQFMGALTSNGANKGLFITTGKFSAPARKIADMPHDKKLVLIDGPHLAKLMIEYGIGVSPVKTYVVKRIDSDYFTE